MAEMNRLLAESFLGWKIQKPRWDLYRESLIADLMTHWPDTDCGRLNQQIHTYMDEWFTYHDVLLGYR